MLSKISNFFKINIIIYPYFPSTDKQRVILLKWTLIRGKYNENLTKTLRPLPFPS